MQDQRLTMAEARLGANLSKDLRQISATDSEFVQGIKRDIVKIDLALQSGDLEQILKCNSEIWAAYGDRLLQNEQLFSMNRDVAQKLGAEANKNTLQIIRQTLQNIIGQEKAQEILQEVSKDGGLYALEKMSQYILDE
jgi:hypothetical protein